MYEFFFYAYVTAIGFCVAGTATSLAQLLTGRQLGFGIDTQAAGIAILGVFTRVIAGPAIVMRNAIKAALRGRPPYWLVLSTLISALWSFFSGVVVLELIYRLST
ncbi:MAG: hypothetical protein Kow0032_15510 [Methyloligellaceae bacterium]|nr:MAG: hypothetical protein D6773_00100 [Alphaproteobacteria bacterium]